MVCVYHSRDLDGWCSAAIVKMKFPNARMIGWDYGQLVPPIKPGETVVMCDISFPKADMEHINNICRLIWIDHHESAKNLLPPNTEGLRDVTMAACELTWQVFFPDIVVPKIVTLLGMYDSFRHKGTSQETEVLMFQYAARARWTDWVDLYGALTSTGVSVDAMIYDGGTIYKYLQTEAKHIYAKRFDVNISGYRFGCVNQERFNPVNFGINYHNHGYDGFMCVWFAKGKWNYSLYNDNGIVDCSKIAKEFGGGGHKGAAGFICDEFVLNKDVCRK